MDIKILEELYVDTDSPDDQEILVRIIIYHTFHEITLSLSLVSDPDC